jgi:DNA-directed RNA polymerase subunit RPC12/RpoP
MSDFKFSCPHCKQHLQVNEQFSGRQIQCPNCNHLIRIPAAPGKTAQYKAESGMTWATFVPPGNRWRQDPQTSPQENKGMNAPADERRDIPDVPVWHAVTPAPVCSGN